MTGPERPMMVPHGRMVGRLLDLLPVAVAESTADFAQGAGKHHWDAAASPTRGAALNPASLAPQTQERSHAECEVPAPACAANRAVATLQKRQGQ